MIVFLYAWLLWVCCLGVVLCVVCVGVCVRLVCDEVETMSLAGRYVCQSYILRAGMKTRVYIKGLCVCMHVVCDVMCEDVCIPCIHLGHCIQ